MAADAGWIAAEIALAPDTGETALEILSAALFEVGAGGLETKDGGDPLLLIASFPPEIPKEELPERIEAALEAAATEAREVVLKPIEPVDWATHWRRNFEPMRFGELWVVPTWLEPPTGAKAVLRIDPSTAFGTGSHATTALCLERILELVPALGPGAEVLDVGTGTGILAMGALVAGAGSAVGTDNDPEALRVARENAELNGLLSKLELSGADPDRLGRRFGLVVANILAEPLIQLAPKLACAVAPGGPLVLSGLLAPQVEAVARAYEALGFTGRAVAERSDKSSDTPWARIDLIGPSP
jgi:ribosomal protein L11 methyltransferase